MVREAPGWVDQVPAHHLVLQHGSALVQRQRTQIPPTLMEAVKDHVDGWGLDGGLVSPAPPEQMELADELVVKDADLAIQDQLRGEQSSD
jgi:hypothetical protein